MIVRMAKVEIYGPKERTLEVLGSLRELGVLELAPEAAAGGVPLRRLHPDHETLSRRLAFQDLQQSIVELCACLPPVPLRTSYLDPEAALAAVREVLPRHLAQCRERQAEIERLRAAAADNEGRAGQLEVLAALAKTIDTEHELLEVIGVVVRDPTLLGVLEREAERLTEGRFTLTSACAVDGTTVAVIATESSWAEQIRTLLQQEQVGELGVPEDLRQLPAADQAAALQERTRQQRQLATQLGSEAEAFARHWLPIYQKILAWLDDRLAEMSASAAVQETELCFRLVGWMPADEVAPLRTEMEQCCAGEVLLQELDLRESDLAQVPVVLANPPYFRPFELFSRLLPLPRYGSYDPTPFIGLFMPIFFGLMLGDCGYGLILLAVALVLLRYTPQPGSRRDLALILLVCSFYTLVFGFLFGECFGEEVGHWLGLTPLLLQRSHALLPMLWFALAVGVIHIGLGLGLGAVSALRQHQRREAAQHLLLLLTLLGATLLVLALARPARGWPLQAGLAAIGLAVPLLLLTGGLLAPLEMLKTFGSIVSYARIMAIGLTSVLLAQVANRLGGLTGDVVAGVVVAGVLHLFNLILGVFAPTVHALRLHYVEFFGKFLETGGRSFKPLAKTPK